MARRFQTVNVFSDHPLKGNPVAVVIDADGMSTDEMQDFTRWTNLSEATFLLEPTHPDADYRLRIFTLQREMPFAGHPTLGSCHAWLTSGGVPHGDDVIQECGAGLVTIRNVGGTLAFAAPPVTRYEAVDVDDLAKFAAALGIDVTQIVDAKWVDNGPGWVAIMLDSAQSVLDVNPVASSTALYVIGLVGPHPAGHDSDFEIRALFSDQFGAIREDPVTGSLNASVAKWLFDTGRATPPYTASQGKRLQRSGRILLDQDAAGTVWVAGATTTVLTGDYIGAI